MRSPDPIARKVDGMTASVILGVLAAAEVAGLAAVLLYVRRGHSR
jgi:hypothetical protein